MYYTIGVMGIACIPAIVGIIKIILCKIWHEKFNFKNLLCIILSIIFLILLTILLSEQIKRGEMF